MIEQQILQPVIALAIWTMIMWAWMYATRIPAMSNSDDIDTANLTGGTGTDLDKLLPDRVQWKAHNYNHLHEQPTIFYAVALTLAVMGHGDGQSALLAWIYVGLRVAHSLVQVTANKVMARFVLFALSSLVLIVLIFKAARIAFGF
jgi:hypothetical protein